MTTPHANPRLAVRIARLAAAALTLAFGAAASAQLPVDQLPPDLEGVGVEDRRGEQVPLDLVFTNSAGEQVRLGDYFEDGKPVILTLNYYRCPMLCNLTLNGMVAGLNEMEMSAGEEFTILTVSFAPEEGYELADVKKRAYLTQYTRESVADGWFFHVGTEENIRALCEAVGFGYRYLPDTGEYSHTATIIFLTPDGIVSRYMNDTLFRERDLRLALVEASDGAIGSALDQFALFMCYQYDPDKNSYVASAWKIMRLGGILTVLFIIAGILILSRLGPKHRKPHEKPVLGGLT